MYSMASVPINIPFVDYAEFYPESQRPLGRGEFATEPNNDEMSAMTNFLSQVPGLLANKLAGYSVIYQRDAYSDQEEGIRDAVLHAVGSFTGFDIDGELTKNELEGELVLAETDSEALGIDPEWHEKPIQATYRSVQFGYLLTKTDWQITEIEIPTGDTIIDSDGTSRTRHLRVLNMVPNPDK